MNRREFIELLTDALVGRVPGRLVSEKADYYRRYISERADGTGRTEAEIIDELGPPEAIAHTIIDAYEAEYGVYEGEEGTSYASYRDTAAGSDSDEEDGNGGRFFHFNLGGNGCFLLFFVVVILFLAIAIWMVRFIAAYPLLVVAAVLAFYIWNEYKKRH